jgi:hypothetical protein
LATALAGCIADRRDQSRVIHDLDDILRARMLAIACGYEDADDLAVLRHDPGFKLALGKLPTGPVGLASQPTMSRWENAPTTRELIQLTGALIDIYCASYPAPPAAVTLDIDETVDVVHGGQQLSFWNGHYGERCFLPIHVYDTATGRPVAMLLRTGKTASGAEVARHLRRLIRHIRRHWPHTHITLRGDGHYGRPEIMAWCEANSIDYVFGLPGNAVLHADAMIVAAADACATDRALRDLVELRRYAETRYAAKSWGADTRRVVARVEASSLGLDIRFVVTSLKDGSAERSYDTRLLRRGSGRKPDQAPQGPAEKRPHLMPIGQRQPDAPHPSHRCLLVDVEAAPGDPGYQRAARRRVHDAADPADQGRRPRRRNRQSRPHRLCQRLSRCRDLPSRRRHSAHSQPVTDAAAPPIKPQNRNPQAQTNAQPQRHQRLRQNPKASARDPDLGLIRQGSRIRRVSNPRGNGINVPQPAVHDPFAPSGGKTHFRIATPTKPGQPEGLPTPFQNGRSCFAFLIDTVGPAGVRYRVITAPCFL